MRSKIRTALCLSIAILALSLPACMSDGHFTIAGYTTAPNFDNSKRTVYVPVFKNDTRRRRLEFELTQAVVLEIELKTDYKVVSDRARADTELSGAIRVAAKVLWNRNQQNTIREAQTQLFVDVSWRDLRTGEILSAPREGLGAPPINQRLARPPLLQPQPGPGATSDPSFDPLGLNNDPRATQAFIPGSTVRSFGMYLPELGGSTATGFQQAINRAAVQIVSLMEKPW